MQLISVDDIKRHKIISRLIKIRPPVIDKPIDNNALVSNRIEIANDWKSAKIIIKTEYPKIIIFFQMNFKIKNTKCVYSDHTDESIWFKDLSYAIDHAKKFDNMIKTMKNHSLAHYIRKHLNSPHIGCGNDSCAFCMLYSNTGIMPTSLPTIPKF